MPARPGQTKTSLPNLSTWDLDLAGAGPPKESASFLQFNFSLPNFALQRGAVDLDELEAALFVAGALSVTLEDAADTPILEPPPGATPLWLDTRIKALFEPNCDRAAIQASVKECLGSAPAGFFESIENRVWEREWLKDFKPMRFGRRLWICPGGQRPTPLEASPPDIESSDAETVEIQLDPGLAFGTGTHPTTALCLEWLDGHPLRGKTLIDYGCGSGILAVAALKLGVRQATGIDIDPQALTASRTNARRNGVEDRLTLRDAPATPSTAAAAAEIEPVHILVANILAEPLQQLAEKFAALVITGGHLVLSGLLQSQAGPVAARYAPWFDIAPAVAREQWIRLEGVRRG